MQNEPHPDKNHHRQTTPQTTLVTPTLVPSTNGQTTRLGNAPPPPSSACHPPNPKINIESEVLWKTYTGVSLLLSEGQLEGSFFTSHRRLTVYG